MSTKLSVENLYKLSDSDVKSVIEKEFINQLCFSKSVCQTFFSKHKTTTPSTLSHIKLSNPDWVDNIAVAMVCSSISSSSLYGFSQTINQSAADNYWKSRLTDKDKTSVQVSQELYNWAFPVYCQAEGVTFKNYLNDNPKSWGQKLANKVTESSFINMEINKLIAADPNWLEKLNLVFYKLNRLDNSLVQGVVDVWSKAFPDKHITVQWQTYNFIPSHLFQTDQFIAEVNTAIAVVTEYKVNPTVVPGTHDVIYYTEYYAGVAVANFLKEKPQKLGLTTGYSPNNNVTQSSGCFIAGTPVLLANGESLPIEEIRENHKVLAKDGALSLQSDERVIIHLDYDTNIYGINKYEPFFSAGHLFWTHDGWKAIDPATALEENPGREVKKLEIGDVVYRVSNLNSFTYEEVTIKEFTTQNLPAGSKLYGLHLLDGPRSYHAHGFCVGMNYPVITAKRIFEGFSKLTESERRLIRSHLEPIMPLLSNTVGRFIEKPIRKALASLK